MKKSIRVTLLVENTAFGRDLRAEHGLAFWIESGSHRILFDTGQSAEVLFHNADCLGIDLSTVDAVILSHGHYDHAGGLRAVLTQGDGVDLFLHPRALAQRYSRGEDGSVDEIGIAGSPNRKELRDQVRSLTWTSECTPILDGISVTGNVPRVTDYEDTGGDFFLDEDCQLPDPIDDDQAVYFDTAKGTVVLLGCAHSGVVNTLRHIRNQTDNKTIVAVLGGTHLVTASEERMGKTVEALKEFDLGLLAPVHCTGPRAQARIASEFPGVWEPTHVGSLFEFQNPGRRA